MQIKILSVSEVTSYIKRILFNDPILHNIRVKGEISNYKLHSSGHMYFTLKDQQSRINCVMFKTNAEKLKFVLEEGLKVTIKGYISVYERDGQYQLYVNDIEPVGMGSLYLAYQQMKEKLEKEGLFDSVKKKPIPFMPEKIALITSPTGAAIRDMISVIRRRYKRVELVIFPVLVQGESAAESIACAIEMANRIEDFDLIITGRGGGSIEELWAFNEERVARAIFQSNIPIISAVGHETDFTIADFVADLRAPTPSVAAELAVPSLRELKENLVSQHRRLVFTMNTRIKALHSRLDRVKNSYPFKYPLNTVYDHRQVVDGLMEDLVKEIRVLHRNKRIKLHSIGQRLNGLSPLSILKRGYCYAQQQNQKVIRSVDDVKIEDVVNIRLMDGKVQCRVINVLKEENTLEKKEI
ncbi:exodeoxyribonuclease VII large subunit [Alkaliphilus hydrothermalis]|uniref:Exodeoxyribonuclease 7 large subunit n=1 Tax=Alkaliphilus hydrothermalis TaxID=1482730 RepID=A0ABS2NM72_9FIRM|nr:exodeoxyribonuclease VII large subunit [Alkaliphilus hydrothermalis]MBM7614007.1 exodeoxyribonuclease VII large subunit [Alkaliphilus hydrothermalis]